MELAAEDVVDSTRVAVAAVSLQNHCHQGVSYQGPFGVGYCVAQLYQFDHASGLRDPDAPNPMVESNATGQCLPSVARQALSDYFSKANGAEPIHALGYLEQAAGVFVTIRTRDGTCEVVGVHWFPSVATSLRKHGRWFFPAHFTIRGFPMLKPGNSRSLPSK